MFNKFKPTWMIESIYDLQPAELKARGIKVVLTDLDNTLIAWNNPLGTPQLREWLEVMKKAELPVVVVSNNNHQRVKKAVAPFGCRFFPGALKQLGVGFNLGKKQFNVKEIEPVPLTHLTLPPIGGCVFWGVPGSLKKKQISRRK